MRRVTGTLLAAVAIGGCGETTAGPEPTPVAPVAEELSEEPTVEPGFDPDDPAVDIIPADDAEIDRLVRQAGTRRDFRIPRGIAAGKLEGPLVLAWVARPFYAPPQGQAWVERLNKGQLAVYAMFYAEFEILNGGFYQLWGNPSGRIADDLAAAAKRVGSPEFASIYRDAAALWPDGRIPRSRSRRAALLDRLDGDRVAELDERYAETQYARRTALGPILARYMRRNADEFVAG